jgi:DNA-binding Lrp family transcriptional regulator
MITTIVLDRKGADFQYLVPMLWHSLTAEEMLLLRASTDPEVCTYLDSPFEPSTAKMPVEEWDIVSAEGMGIGALGLLHPGSGALLETGHKTRKELDAGDHPTFYHMLPKFKELRPKKFAEKGRTDAYSHAEQRVRQAIVQAPIVFSCTRGIPFEEYMRRRLVIIDISKCGIFAADLITHIFLLKLYKWAQYEGRSEQGMRVAVFLDEGERVFGQRQQAIAGELFLDSFLRTSRAYNIWVFIGNQTFSTLSAAARKTAGAKIFFSLDGSETRLVAESTGMTREQAERFGGMEPGQMLVKMDSRPQLRAFFGRVPHIPIDRSVPQREIDAFFAPKIAELRAKVRFIDEQLKDRVMALIFKEDEKAPKERDFDKPAIDKKMLAFLEQVAKNAFRMTKDHAAALNIKPKECSVIQRAAAGQGLVELYTVKLDDRPGKPATYTALTDNGRKILVKAGILKEGKLIHPGKSDYFHALLTTGVMHKLTGDKGTACKLEDSGCDIGLYRNSQPLAAIELSCSTTPEDELRNIRRNLDGWPHIITIIASTRKEIGATIIDDEKSEEKKNKAIRLICEHLGEDEQRRIQIFTFHEFRRLKRVL